MPWGIFQKLINDYSKKTDLCNEDESQGSIERTTNYREILYGIAEDMILDLSLKKLLGVSPEKKCENAGGIAYDIVNKCERK